MSMAGLRRLYGEHPIHLVGVLACLAVAAAALVHLVAAGPLRGLAIWLGGAIVLHDLVLFPLYAALDRVAVRTAGRGAINYVRIPTLLSGLMLLLFFPLILGVAKRYQQITGVSPDVYFQRWLAISAVLFAGSALLYLARTVRGRRVNGR